MSNRVFDQRWPWFLAAGLVMVGFLLTQIERRPFDSRPVGSVEDIERLSERADLNVLFILIDTLRANRLGMYGYERDTSPMLDWMAESGIRFGRHLAQSSWTKSSMASLWTALYPERNGILRYNDVISDRAVLPAEILQEAGFHTVGLWRNGWVAPNFGFAQGFDVYHRPGALPLAPSERRKNPSMTTVGSDSGLVEAVNTFFLSAPPERRWFLYLHLMDLHQYTYDADSALFGTSFSDIYDNSIRREDSMVDAIVGLLAEAGELDRTIVVVATDHGEAFGERGFEGHAQNVYPETTEIPLIFFLPFRLEPGIVVESRTRNIDVWPTLLDLLGLPAMEEIDGESLLPAILAASRGEPPLPELEPSYSELDRHWGRPSGQLTPTVSASLGDHRYVLWTGVDETELLFDRRGDPDERHDVIEEQPEIARVLREASRAYLEASPLPPWGEDAPTVELDEMQLNQLRALGYEL
jgi:arylsulfatase A-like enzyme